MIKDSIDSVLAVYSAEIGTYKKLISDLDESISKIVSTLPEAKVLESILRIEKVYSAGIIAKIGSIDCFDAEAQLAKYAGLARTQKQSRSFNSEHIPLSKTGNLARLKDPVFAEYYRKKYDEAPFFLMKTCLRTNHKKTRSGHLHFAQKLPNLSSTKMIDLKL